MGILIFACAPQQSRGLHRARLLNAGFCLGSFLSIAAFAAEPAPVLSPMIQSIFPRGGQQGHKLEIVIQGRHLERASEIRVSGAGVRGQVRDSSESQITAVITISADAPVGRRDLRVLTPQGSFVQMLEVGALPDKLDSEPNAD